MGVLNKTAIIVCGPTAVGKTSVAISIAKSFNTEIISADSRQCFKELNIGVARPSEKEVKEIRHYFIASHSINDTISAAIFERYALQKAGEIFQKHHVVVIVGGTGLYIRAFTEGLDDIPEVEENVRNQIVKSYNEKGLRWLQDEIKEKDPQFYSTGEVQNPQRLMRALEVIESTGRSILDFRKKTKAIRSFNIIKIGLDVPKDQLHQNINSRVDKMIEQGLVEEARSLISAKHVNALQTVGYSEIFEYIDGKISLETAIDDIKKNTRQYAKRQLTWFRKDKEIKWFSPGNLNEIISYVKETGGL